MISVKKERKKKKTNTVLPGQKGAASRGDFFSFRIYVADEPLGILGLSAGSFPNAVAATKASKRYPAISPPAAGKTDSS